MGKLDGATSAVWESNIKHIFCDICLKEVEAGNRPTTFFNKEGWQNITANFKERTGREYNKVQLKNKWDQLKKDLKLWKELKRGSTGLGWDPRKKTIDASDDWWREKLEVLPQARKFRYVGIEPELEDKLDIMFGGVVATRGNAWTPGLVGCTSTQSRAELDEPEESNDLEEDVSPVLFANTQSSGSKRSCPSRSSGRMSKKGSATNMKDQISGLLTVCIKLMTSESSNTAYVEESITLLESMPEVVNDEPLFLYSIDLLEDPTKRAIFLALSADSRVRYLRGQFRNQSTHSSSKG